MARRRPAAARGRLGPHLAAGMVLLSSGAVLVLELSALRLLAPVVGLTLEMSTAVIGVALAAIAFGTWAGGRAADMVDPAAWVGPLVATGGLASWLVLPAVRGTSLVGGQDAGPTLGMALLALFAPAALLSAVTPMVVASELRSLADTGTVVGRLSAVGTVGALLATFGTGFVLFATVPTSRIIVALGAILVVAGAALIVMRQRRAGAGAAAGVVVAGGLIIAAPSTCEVETRYHCASVSADPARPDGRVLRLDQLRHSYVDVADPTHLEFMYVRAMATAVDASFPAGRAIDALHLGAGGLTLPRYLAATRPGSTGVVLEIDGGVVDLVRDRIGVEPPGVDVHISDARVGLARQPSGAFDVVIGDAFGSVAVPWHLATREAVQEVRRSLAPGGLYALNVIDQPPLALLRAELATVADVFGSVALVSDRATLAGADGGNAVVLASDEPLAVTAIGDLLQRRDPAQAVLSGSQLERFIAGAAVLTDDLAPVDQLLTTYAQR